MAKHLRRVIGLRARKPFTARHSVFRQRRFMGGGGQHFKVVPNALPKVIEFCRRPTPQRVVVVKLQAAFVAQPVLVQTNLRCVGGGFVSVGHWYSLSTFDDAPRQGTKVFHNV